MRGYSGQAVVLTHVLSMSVIPQTTASPAETGSAPFTFRRSWTWPRRFGDLGGTATTFHHTYQHHPWLLVPTCPQNHILAMNWAKKDHPKKRTKWILASQDLWGQDLSNENNKTIIPVAKKNKIIPQQQWHDGSFSAEDLPKPIAVVEKISNNSFCPYIYIYIYIYISPFWKQDDTTQSYTGNIKGL